MTNAPWEPTTVTPMQRAPTLLEDSTAPVTLDILALDEFAQVCILIVGEELQLGLHVLHERSSARRSQ